MDTDVCYPSAHMEEITFGLRIIYGHTCCSQTLSIKSFYELLFASYTWTLFMIYDCLWYVWKEDIISNICNMLLLVLIEYIKCNMRKQSFLSLFLIRFSKASYKTMDITRLLNITKECYLFLAVYNIVIKSDKDTK